MNPRQQNLISHKIITKVSERRGNQVPNKTTALRNAGEFTNNPPVEKKRNSLQSQGTSREEPRQVPPRLAHISEKKLGRTRRGICMREE